MTSSGIVYPFFPDSLSAMTAWFADFSVTPSYAPSKTWSKFYFIEPSKQVLVKEIKQYRKMHMLD
jgi:hypothetical protein